MGILDEPLPAKPKEPTTCREWWAYFNHHKENLRSLVVSYHPRNRHEWDDEPANISAPLAEAACEVVRDLIRKEQPIDVGAAFDRADRERDGPVMVGLLDAAWFGLPESMSSRDVDGFWPLCTLCEESELVVPEEGVS